MKEQDLEYRMYGLVPYNISPIQQGIQFGHAVVEYMLGRCSIALEKWSEKDKTFIILNGGTTNLGYQQEGKGSLNLHTDQLKLNNIDVATFHEPDLGDQLTAVVFLVDERVFNKKKYPDFQDYVEQQDRAFRMMWQSDQHAEWLKHIGGEKNLFLREFLKQFRLA